VPLIHRLFLAIATAIRSVGAPRSTGQEGQPPEDKASGPTRLCAGADPDPAARPRFRQSRWFTSRTVFYPGQQEPRRYEWSVLSAFALCTPTIGQRCTRGESAEFCRYQPWGPPHHGGLTSVAAAPRRVEQSPQNPVPLCGKQEGAPVSGTGELWIRRAATTGK